MRFNRIIDANLKGKRLFIRVDMNAPIVDGVIMDNTRIKASIPTIKLALDKGAKVIVATHLGRPTEGKCSKDDSIMPVANELAKELKIQIPIISDIDDKIDFSTSRIVMLENVRCNVGEKSNSEELGKKYARLCDAFVHDAFATAHRREASTDAVGRFAKEVYAGMLMSSELDALSKVMINPKRPIIAIVSGSKVSTKLALLENLADKVDTLIVGGGILNTFLAAEGLNIGKSLCDYNMIDFAKSIINKMKTRRAAIPLPKEVVVAKECSKSSVAVTKVVAGLEVDDMILDIGVSFANDLVSKLATAGTIIWNGPMGVFELEQFANGTYIVANGIVNSQAFSLAGGGDTIAAINKFGIYDRVSYVSTAGGALLEFLEGKRLPAIDLLEQKIIQ